MDSCSLCFVFDTLLMRLKAICSDVTVSRELIGSILCLVDGAGISKRTYISTCVGKPPMDGKNPLWLIPGGFERCGLCIQTTCAESAAAVHKLCTAGHYFSNWGSKETMYVLAVTNLPTFAAYLYKKENSGLCKVEYTPFGEGALKSWIICRLRASIPLVVDFAASPDDLTYNITMEIQRVQANIMTGTTAFSISNSTCVCFVDEISGCDLTNNSPFHQMFDLIDDENVHRNNKRRKAGDYSKDIVHLTLLHTICASNDSQRTIGCSPVIHHEHKTFLQYALDVPIDVCVYMHANDDVQLLADRLMPALTSQLQYMSHCLTQNAQTTKGLSIPEVMFCHPGPCGHLVSAVYAKDIPDHQLEFQRKALHKMLLLGLDRPYLRRLNSYQWPDIIRTSSCLENVHEGLQPSKVIDGHCSIVSGKYSYHHYMQDRINDDGWGCAYRSLQTLVSWFRHQGYTQKEIPSHQQIQQILVDINDKPSSIVGSKTWIGSTEVGYVLDAYLDVTSKILFVNNGLQMSSKGRELAMHFDCQGTPIMIGGGVLAHTILGVDFNEVSGAVQFLVLDPHYTGSEDLRIIQDKGWCSWKSADFWEEHAHYNMCMPQRPITI